MISATALTDAVWLVEEVAAVAQRLLCVLIDRDRDRLDVLIAVALARGALTQLSKRLDPGRVVRVLVVPLQTPSPAPAAKHASFR